MVKLSPRKAVAKLEAAIAEAGSAKAYAQQIGVSEADISRMRRRGFYLSPKVAEALKLQRIVTQTVCYVELSA